MSISDYRLQLLYHSVGWTNLQSWFNKQSWYSVVPILKHRSAAHWRPSTLKFPFVRSTVSELQFLSSNTRDCLSLLRWLQCWITYSITEAQHQRGPAGILCLVVWWFPTYFSSCILTPWYYRGVAADCSNFGLFCVWHWSILSSPTGFQFDTVTWTLNRPILSSVSTASTAWSYSLLWSVGEI